MSEKVYKIAIVGAGPSGLAAAVRASHYPDRCSYIVLESSADLAGTIEDSYQDGKHVMAEPESLPKREGLPFSAGRKEDIIGSWKETIKRLGIDKNIRFKSRLEAVARTEQGSCRLTLADGAIVEAENVILAIGKQVPRKLGIPGQELPMVQPSLSEGESIDNEDVVVVGGDDKAMAAARALAARNRVVIVHSREALKGTDDNVERTTEAIRSGRIKYIGDAEVVRVVREGERRGNVDVRTAQSRNPLRMEVDRVIGDVGVPGRNSEIVKYGLRKAAAYVGKTIVIFGGGDAGIEDALALARGYNKVVLLNAYKDLVGQPANVAAATAAIESGKIAYYGEVKVCRVDQKSFLGKEGRIVFTTPMREESIWCHEIILRIGSDFPVELLKKSAIGISGDGKPQVNTGNRSTVEGIYVIGSLAGAATIKPGINQGYDVVEGILNADKYLAPIDEDIIKRPPAKKEKGADFGRFLTDNHLGTVNDGLLEIQNRVPFLAELNLVELREMLFDSTVRYLKENDLVFKQGDYGESFFSILKGSLQLEIVNDGGSKGSIPLASGMYFGEIGLLSGRRRSGTVTARTECVLIETPRQAILKRINSRPRMRSEIDSVWLRRTLRSIFGRWVSAEDLKDVEMQSVIKTFSAGEELFGQGADANGIYFIQEGSVIILRNRGDKELVLSYVAAGNLVGEGAFLTPDRKRSTAARAAIRCKTFFTPAEVVETVLARNPALHQQLKTELDKLVIREATVTDSQVDIVNYLLGQGIGESTDVLLIDESLCIRCDNCEKACADTHDGISRLDREAGPTFANVHVPTSCRHCEHPHCMKDCPPDAIRRRPTGEVEILDRCIGCGKCQSNCPYKVIQMGKKKSSASGRLPRWLGRPSLYAWMLTGFTTEPGREQEKQASHDGNAQSIAVKCDLCKDQVGGAACVRACPTGAAIRVKPEEFLNSGER